MTKKIFLSKNNPVIEITVYDGKIYTNNDNVIGSLGDSYMLKVIKSNGKEYKERVYYPNKFEGYEYDEARIKLLEECSEKLKEIKKLSENKIEHERIAKQIFIRSYNVDTKMLSVSVWYDCPRTIDVHDVILENDKPVICTKTVYLANKYGIYEEFDIPVDIEIEKEIIFDAVIATRIVYTEPEPNSYELYDNEDKAEYRSRTDSSYKRDFRVCNIEGVQKSLYITFKFNFDNIDYIHKGWMCHRQKLESGLTQIYGTKDVGNIIWDTIYTSQDNPISYIKDRNGIKPMLPININRL